MGRLYDRGWEGQFDRHKSVSPLLNIAYVRADLAQALGDVACRLVWLTKRPRQSNLDTARAACKRYLELAEVELPDVPAKPTEAVECHVTLLQMAAIVNKSKRSLQRLRDKGNLLVPAVHGGKGKADEWRWTEVRPILEKEYRRQLPEVFPSDRFIRR